MRMKKVLPLSLLLIFAYVSLPSLGGLGELRQQTPELSGLITEVLEGGIILTDAEKGPVLLNVDAETVLEGVLGGSPLEVGMYVFAKYDGILIRSSPPQTHADRLGCYALKGVVSEALNGGLLVTGDEIYAEALVHVKSYMPQAFPGVPVTVYYNGTMTMSLPPQVNAQYLVVPVLSGKVKELNADSLSLIGEDRQEYTIQLSSKTLVPSNWFDGGLRGKDVVIYYNGTIGHQNELVSLEIKDPTNLGTSMALENIPQEVLTPPAEESPSPEALTPATMETPEPSETPTPADVSPSESPEPETTPEASDSQEATGSEEAPTPIPPSESP